MILTSRPKNCLVCGTALLVKSVGRPKKYCSSTCRSKIRSEEEYVCLECGKPFTGRKRNREVKFCSHKCHYDNRTYTIEQKEKHVCKICNKNFYKLPGDSNLNMYCSKRCQLISVGSQHRAYTEDIIEKQLIIYNIVYETQFNYHSYYADFYIPKFDLLLELDGRTWHSKPKARDRDCIKSKKANELGYNMLRLWCSRKKEAIDLDKYIQLLSGDDLAAFIVAIPNGIINSVNLVNNKGVVITTANGENQTTGNAVPSLNGNVFEGVETRIESKLLKHDNKKSK